MQHADDETHLRSSVNQRDQLRPASGKQNGKHSCACKASHTDVQRARDGSSGTQGQVITRLQTDGLLPETVGEPVAVVGCGKVVRICVDVHVRITSNWRQRQRDSRGGGDGGGVVHIPT
jgi:hypothetical protein